MSKIRFYFYHWSDLMSKIIQWRTVSYFNHVAVATIENGVEYVYQVWGSWVKKEVHPLNGYNKEKTKVYYVDVEVDKNKFDEIKRYLDKQVGKKYDWLAIRWFGIWKYEQDKKRWFCSELAEVVLEKIEGRQIWRNKLVSPWNIAMYFISKSYDLIEF